MIEVLKQALDALERSVATCFDQYAHQQVMSQPDHFINQAITSLRQAIKELESQEPVALPCCGYTDASAVKWNSLNDVVQCHNCGQTYALLPQEKNT